MDSMPVINVNINTIIFDLGAVLIDWNPIYLYQKLFDSDEEMNYFLTHICTSVWNEEQDAGRSINIATEQLIQEYPAWESLIRAYYERWEEMLRGPIDDSVALFHHLRKNPSLKMYALTNWSAETWPIAWARFNFLHDFDGILVSGQEKLKKPDPRIYRLLFERYEIDPSRAIFIDDNIRNIEAGIQEGLQGIHFKDPEQLSQSLIAYELL
jgi:2-haloacid dehalogenase